MPTLCLHTEMWRPTQGRGLSGGRGGRGGGHRPCPLFPSSDAPLRPSRAPSSPRHMGAINHCWDLGERSKLSRDSSSAIKTIFMILCLLLTDPEILSPALTTDPPRQGAPPPITTTTTTTHPPGPRVVLAGARRGWPPDGPVQTPHAC